MFLGNFTHIRYVSWTQLIVSEAESKEKRWEDSN